MSRVVPRIAVLDSDGIARVHHASLEVLAGTGVRVDSPRARALFEKAGCESRGGGRVL